MDKPFAAYKGGEPYVFVCHAHADAGVVYPEIRWLHEQGVNLWYDEGISAGKIWREEIGDAIKGASSVLYYISASSLASDHCDREINFALDQHKNVLPVYLEDVALTTDLEVGLSRVQALHRDQDASYQQHLLNALGQPAEAAPPSPAQPPKLNWRRSVQTGLAVAILLGAGWWYWQGPVPSSGTEEGKPKPAIAVLPFVNMSSDPEQDYFSDGITEDLITRLSQLLSHGEAVAVGLPVIARTSTFVFKGKAQNIAQVGRELRARYIVEGSVRRSEGRVRITAQLVEAASGHHIWAETYDRDLTDIFEIQDEISAAIARAIGFRVGRSEMERVERMSTSSLDAWETAHKATGHFQRMNRADMRTARELFTRVTELDPRWVWPYQALVTAHMFEVIHQWSNSPEQSIREMVRLARHAAALDSLDPYAHLAMGTAYAFTGQPENALSAYEKARELSPNLLLADLFIGTHLAARDPGSALKHYQRILDLNPHDPYLNRVFNGMSAAHYAAGRFDRALEFAEKSLAVRRDYAGAHRMLAASLVELGRIDEAREAFTQAMTLQPEFNERFARLLGGKPRYVEALLSAGLSEYP